MAITGDNQWEWRSFKVGDPDTTGFAVVQWDPGAPPIVRNPLPRVGGHGTILPRADFLGGRAPSLDIEVEATTRSNLLSKMDALDAATLPVSTGDEALSFQILGVTRRINCRPHPARWLWNGQADTGLWVAGVVVEFYAQDPRVYAGSTTVTVLT